MAILETRDLSKHFRVDTGLLSRLTPGTRWSKALDGVSLSVEEGEIYGVVGESGCGKSTLGKTVVGYHEPTEGRVLYRGEDLTAMSGRERRTLRTELQFVFQDFRSSLDPRMTVGDVLAEPLTIHSIGARSERRERVAELLALVDLQPSLAGRYPHALSGGQRQRVAIARALAVDPAFVVADEPTSALDANVQATILNLLLELQEDLDFTLVFISHDLELVQHVSDRIAVMYLGRIVERGTTEEVFAGPSHPYTEALLSAIPSPDPDERSDRIVLDGAVPSPEDPPGGCRFHPRCPEYIGDVCENRQPRQLPQSDTHTVQCHLFDDERDGRTPDGE